MPVENGMTDLSALLSQRYGPDAPPIPPGAFADNPTLPVLLAHKSVRHYKSDALAPGTLEVLGAAAQSAASSSNLQTWSVVALQDPAHKAEAATLCGDQDFIRLAPLFLVFCADLARLSAASEHEGLPGGALDYTEMFVTAVIDAALAAQNAAVAAEGLGLGICYVGAARNHPRELAALLHLPPRVIALFGLAVGHPADDDTASVKPRLPQPGLVHHETYDTEARDRSVPSTARRWHAFTMSRRCPIGGRGRSTRRSAWPGRSR